MVIAAAGAAAHLAGVMAASTTLPVIGVPMATSTLNGLDALLATVQMPGGIPVATMAIDKAGAVNAAIFAAEILALSDPEIARKLVAHKEDLAQSVAEKNARLQKQTRRRKIVAHSRGCLDGLTSAKSRSIWGCPSVREHLAADRVLRSLLGMGSGGGARIQCKAGFLAE